MPDRTSNLRNDLLIWICGLLWLFVGVPLFLRGVYNLIGILLGF